MSTSAIQKLFQRFVILGHFLPCANAQQPWVPLKTAVRKTVSESCSGPHYARRLQEYSEAFSTFCFHIA